MVIKWVLIIVLCAFLGVESAYAQWEPGPGNEFILGAGARAQGMGNAYCALANDPTATYWNPAGLAQIKKRQITSMNSSLTEDRSYELLAGAMPLSPRETLGFGYLKVGVSEIVYTDIFANITGYGKYSATQYIISYAKEIENNILLGASFKKFKNDITLQASASGFGFDVGAIYKLDAEQILSPSMSTEYLEKLTVGFLIQDISAKRKWSTGNKETYAVNYKIGATATGMEGKLLVAFDWDKIAGSHIGGEYWLIDKMALRGGSDDGKFTWGATFRTLNYQVDYAEVQDQEGLGDTKRIAFTYSF